MRRPNLRKWRRDVGLKNLLLFSHAIEELLFHHTIDSYKSPALNVHLRVKELRILAVDYQAGRIMQGALKPVLEELKWSFRNDVVIKSNITDIFDCYIDVIEKSIGDCNKFLQNIRALEEEIDRYYWKNLKNIIVDRVANGEDDDEIIGLATTFSCEVEALGFSKSYLYVENREFFFEGNLSNNIEDVAVIEKFLEKFDVEYNKWYVVFRGSKEFVSLEPYSSRYGIEITPNRHGMEYESQIGRDARLTENYPLYIIVNNIRALDPYDARDSAYIKTDQFISAYKYHDHNIEINYDKNATVFDVEFDRVLYIKENPNPMTCRSIRSENLEFDDIAASVELLKGDHLDIASTVSINRAFAYHKAALESVISENQLLNLWASIEGVLPPPDSDNDRILFYLDALVPPTTLTYSMRLFSYVSDALYHAGSGVRRIVESIEEGETFGEKTTIVLTCDDMEQKRLQLLSKLRFNPLLHNRCQNINNKFCSTSNTHRTLLEHRKKVRWHIQRIYITRNQIMHNAKSLPYIKTLVENLHTYVDLFLYCLTNLAYSAEMKKSISTFVRMLNVHETTILSKLKGNDIRANTQNYKDVVFGLVRND